MKDFKIFAFLLVAGAVFLFEACNKDNVAQPTETTFVQQSLSEKALPNSTTLTETPKGIPPPPPGLSIQVKSIGNMCVARTNPLQTRVGIVLQDAFYNASLPPRTFRFWYKRQAQTTWQSILISNPTQNLYSFNLPNVSGTANQYEVKVGSANSSATSVTNSRVYTLIDCRSL